MIKSTRSPEARAKRLNTMRTRTIICAVRELSSEVQSIVPEAIRQTIASGRFTIEELMELRYYCERGELAAAERGSFYETYRPIAARYCAAKLYIQNQIRKQTSQPYQQSS